MAWSDPTERTRIAGYAPSEERTLELMRFLLAGSRGGRNRGRILELLLDCPRNAHEISRELGLNYGTVTMHLRTLSDAGLIVSLNPGRYGQGFAPSPVLRRNPRILEGLYAR